MASPNESPSTAGTKLKKQPSAVVVGAGPVGLVSALALQRYGFQVTVLEGGRQLEGVSHADTLQPGALDRLDEIGVLDDVRIASDKIDVIQFRELDGTIVASLDLSILGGETKHAFQLCSPQTWMVRILAEHLQMRSVPVHFSSTVRRLDQASGRVRLAVDHEGHMEGIEADYLVAADGARSSMRTALHIPFVGPRPSNRVIEIMTTYDFPRVFPSLASSAHFMDAAFPFSLARVMGPWRALLPVPESLAGRQLLNSRWHVESLEKIFAMNPRVPIMHETVYDVRSGVAERFRLGNVFLVGDAARVCLPFASMGLSSGIVDACTLAEALALDAASPLDLVDSWAENRKAAALRATAESNQFFADLCAPATARAARNDRLQHLMAHPADCREYLRRITLLETNAPASSSGSTLLPAS